MARWSLEMVSVAVLASLAGAVTPRVLVRDLPQALAGSHASGAAGASGGLPAGTPVAPASGEIVFDDPPEPSSTGSTPMAHTVARGRMASPPRRTSPVAHGTATTTMDPAEPTGPAPIVQPIVQQGVLSRTGSRWTVDLRRLPNARAAVAGMRVLPLGEDGTEGQGYQVTALDRMGLCRTLGVQPGDVLVAVNNRPTLTADQALDAYIQNRRRSAVDFTFRRGTRTFTVPVDVLGTVE